MRVSSNGRASASQADDVPIHPKSDIHDQKPNVRYWPEADIGAFRLYRPQYYAIKYI